MFTSIYEDFRNTFRTGNMISRIILVNVVVFVIVNLVNVFDFDSGFYQILIRKLSLLSDPFALLLQFWSTITFMFLHVGFWHILWNMILLYWFGRIVGDFLGDRRVLPLYILGGLAGGLFFILWDQLGGTGQAFAYGASASVLAVVMAVAFLSPDYIFHLILIGPVKVKYIALGMLLLDLFGTAGNVNTGGHWGHLGGALLGGLFVYYLRQGTDITLPLQNLFERIEMVFAGSGSNRKKTSKKKFKVYKNETVSDQSINGKKGFSEQSELDRILEKIKAEGFEKLTEEGKGFSLSGK